MAYTGSAPTYTSFPVDYFSGDGVTTSFNLTYPASAEGSVLVTVNNQHVYANKYTVNNKSLVFNGYVPPIGTNNIEVIYLGVPSISEGVTGVTSVGIASDLSGVTVTNSPVITAGVIRLGGTLNVSNGGTGNTTLSQNNVLLGNGSNAISAVSTLGSSNQVLTSNGVGSAPTWTSIVNSFSAGATGLTPGGTNTGAITLGGTLNIASGGTGVTTVPLNRVVLGNGNNPLTTVANTGNANQVLTSQGANNAPIWVDVAVRSVTATSGMGLTLTNTSGNIVLAGTLAITNGGTGSISYTPNTLVVANNLGTALISFANGTTGQVLSINASGQIAWQGSTSGVSSITGVSGIGLTFTNTSGAVTVGGTLSIANGGTNATSYTAGTLIVADSLGTSLVSLANGTTGQVLGINASNQLAWQSAGSITSVTGVAGLGLTFSTASGVVTIGGILSTANGGTNNASYTANTLVVSNGSANGLVSFANGTAGQVLASLGATGPSWIALPVSNVTASAGLGLTFTNTSGTVTVGGILSTANGGTNATSYVANRLIISNGTGNAFTSFPTGTTGQVITADATGSPAWQNPIFQSAWTTVTSVPIGGIVLAQLSASPTAYSSQANLAIPGGIVTITGTATPYLILNNGGVVVSLDPGNYRCLGCFTGTSNGFWVRIS